MSTIPVLSLVTAANITDLKTGSLVRCYQNTIPQDAAIPAMRWVVIWGNPEAYLEAAPSIDAVGVQIDVYANSAADANRIGRAVLVALENNGLNVCIGNIRTDFEQETERHSFGFDMEFWVSR